VESPNIFLPPERMSAPLASREARLAGAMIDAAVIVVGYLIGAVIAYFNGTMQSVDWAALKEDQSALFDPDRAEFWLLVHISLAALPLRIVQWLLIARRAQSLGKIIMRTRIVRFENGRDIGFLRGVGVRVWFKELLWGIPVVGPALMVFDPLLIFTAQRRCLHDYFASSLVVEAK